MAVHGASGRHLLSTYTLGPELGAFYTFNPLCGLKACVQLLLSFFER